jgi:hypothetical protein
MPAAAFRRVEGQNLPQPLARGRQKVGEAESVRPQVADTEGRRQAAEMEQDAA